MTATHRTDAAKAANHAKKKLGSRTTIGEVMTPTPHTIGRDQTLSRAFDMMREYKLRHLPVLDAGKLVGVLSQRDLYFVEAIAGVNRGVDSVSEAMASEIFTVAPGAYVTDVAKTMGERRYGCAVVVDRGKVVGIFTATDALALVARMGT